MGIVRRAKNLIECPRVLKGCFYANVLSSLEHCPLWISSAESHLGLIGNIVLSAESLCLGELGCLGHRRKVKALCLLNKIYHKGDYPTKEYPKHFLAARNTSALAALSKLTLVIPGYRTD